jgi:hypothetical protein
MKDTDPRILPLIDHFEELLLLGEIRATRLVSEMVDGMEVHSIRPNTTEDNDKNVYLPSSDGYQSCYYRYMKEQGYTVCPLVDGNLEILWDGNNSLVH